MLASITIFDIRRVIANICKLILVSYLLQELVPLRIISILVS